jgi:hypothetical protein
MHKSTQKKPFGRLSKEFDMSQPLQSINLVAPAFKGVNTEDSPIAQDPSFAELADNAVIDKRGRIAARKGINLQTSDKTLLGTDRIHNIHHFYDSSDNEVVFSIANNKILTGTETLTLATPLGYTITNNEWKIVNFNNAAYFFQNGKEPLIYTNAGGLETFSSYNGTAFNGTYFCGEAVAAYGRLWITDNAADRSTVFWSDLLIGTDYTGGTSGSIDVSKAWPDGYDEIQALAAHNNFLIIFGRHSILVFQNASSPSMMSLADTVAGVGCVDKHSVQHTGTDVLFLSQTGLRSFGRTIQEKSMPLTDLSRNIKQELVNLIETKLEPVTSVYSPENAFYLLTFPEFSTTYCFDLRGTLENGSYRVTRWPSSKFKAWERKQDGTLLLGTVDGIGEYLGYSDEINDGGGIVPSSYRFNYLSPGLTFGDPSKLKILKKLRPTIVGANSATVFVKWSYDFEETFKTASYTVGNQDPAFFGVGEFGIGEFTGGSLTSRRVVNTTGDGTIITIGLEADINGFPLSLQEINVLALMGKTL